MNILYACSSPFFIHQGYSKEGKKLSLSSKLSKRENMLFLWKRAIVT